MFSIKDFGRIVNVNSMLMSQGALDFSAPETIYKVRIWSEIGRVESPYFVFAFQIGRTPPMMRHVPTGYADSKLSAAILNREMAERYKVSASVLSLIAVHVGSGHWGAFMLQSFPNLRFYATCPGFCKTELSREVNFSLLRKVSISIHFNTFMQGFYVQYIKRFHSDPPRAAIFGNHEGRSARRLQHSARHHSRRTAKWRLLQVGYAKQGFTTSTVHATELDASFIDGPLNVSFVRFLQRVHSGREGERQDRQVGDRGRRREAALGAVGTVPRNAAHPDLMWSG